MRPFSVIATSAPISGLPEIGQLSKYIVRKSGTPDLRARRSNLAAIHPPA
jgi:hypothetical protein